MLNRTVILVRLNKNTGFYHKIQSIWIALNNVIYHYVISCDKVIYLVKIQLDLSEDEDAIIQVYKSVNKLTTKQEAIKAMIKHFQVEIKPKNVQNKEYFK